MIFKKYPNTWSWDSLSPLYRDSPFLSLDIGISEVEIQSKNEIEENRDEENKDESNKDEANKDEENKNEENKDEENKDEPKCYQNDNEENSDKKNVSSNLITEKEVLYGPMVRDVMSQLRNISYDFDNIRNKSMYESLRALLTECEKMREKENSIPILPKQQQKAKSHQKYAKLLLNRKRKSNSRVGEKSEEIKKSKVIKVDVEKPTKVHRKEEPIIENIVDSNGMGLDQFKTNDVITLDSSSGDEEVTLTNYPTKRSDVTQGDLAELSNNQMLSDRIIYAMQKMIAKKYPMVQGLQDTILGQTLSFDVMKNRPFLQVS